MERTNPWITVIVLLLAACSLSQAGPLGGPGKYNGVVIFDRWDACYLYSGALVMPVSEVTKSRLREFEGKFVLLDVEKVNPATWANGDLIVQIRAIEPGKAIDPKAPIFDGLVLRTSLDAHHGPAQVNLAIANAGKKALRLNLDQLGITLFVRKDTGQAGLYASSDGPSFAASRSSLDSAKYGLVSEYGGIAKYAIARQPANSFPTSGVWILNIEPGKRRIIPLKFSIPPGEYEFLAGFGGRMHESPVVVSNRTDFKVDADGTAEPLE